MRAQCRQSRLAFAIDGEAHLIAKSPGSIHAKGGLYQIRWQAERGEFRLHAGALPGKLIKIAQVLQPAAATIPKDGARRGLAFRRGMEHAGQAHQRRAGMAALAAAPDRGPVHVHLHDFAGDAAQHLQRRAVGQRGISLALHEAACQPAGRPFLQHDGGLDRAGRLKRDARFILHISEYVTSVSFVGSRSPGNAVRFPLGSPVMMAVSSHVRRDSPASLMRDGGVRGIVNAIIR